MIVYSNTVIMTIYENLNNKNNKNVDIKISAHDTFLEYTSSGMLKIERLENQ